MRRWPAWLALVLVGVFAACDGAAAAREGTVTGTAVFGEALAMPPGALFEATLEDVSRTDVAADVLATTRIEDAGNPPYRFVLTFDPARIVPSRRYVVRARVTLAGRLLFTSETAQPVITNAGPMAVEIVLRQVAGAAGRDAGKPGDLFATLPATFTGTLPCADCEGIAMHLDVLPDASFMLRTRYLGQPEESGFDDLGSWAPSSDGVTVAFQGTRQAPFYFAIEGADTLRMLDVAGRPFESKLNYDLKRNEVYSPIEPALSLRGMFTYLADAASFGECLTGRRLPVAMEAGYVDLERAYLAARTGPGQPLMAQVEGRIVARAPMEGPGSVPTLVVERFLRVMPGEHCAPRFAAAPLEGTYWKLVSLGEERVGPIEGQPGPGLALDSGERRLGGSDGCNRLMAGYTLEGDRIRLTEVAATMMACPRGMELAQRYVQALAATRRWRVLGRQLEFYDGQDRLLARFEAGTAP